MNVTQSTNAFAYIRRIRNSAKRDYARAYLLHLQGGPQPETAGLSYMAAQAVRHQLGAIVKAASNQQFANELVATWKDCGDAA